MIRRMTVLAGLILLVCPVAASVCGAATFFVDASYTGIGNGSQGKPYSSIANGLAWAVNGDTVLVMPGLYRENVVLKPGVSLISRLTGGAIILGRPILPAQQPTVTGADGALISGFVITGGYGGIACNGTSPTIRRNIIRGNFTHGIACGNHSQAVIENNTILGNLGTPSTGRSIGIYSENSTPVIRNNIVTGNSVGLGVVHGLPLESYNDFWGNRRDISGVAAGPGTISADPMFVDIALAPNVPVGVDDYRLDAASPCRDAGDPDPQFNDANGTRNDMGAFDGNGGWRLSLPAQEYVVESVLSAVDFPDGPLINGTSRFTENPVFWFHAASHGTQGEADARALLIQGVPTLTNGLFQAHFWDSQVPPYDLCSVVHVLFDGPPAYGQAYYQGADASCGDPGFVNERAGVPIIGGYVRMPAEYLNGFATMPVAVDTFLHELGHVFSLHHSFRGVAIMGYGSGCCHGDYQKYERDAFAFLYSNPTGISFDALLSRGKLARTVFYPFPRIDKFQMQDENGFWQNITTASRGDAILLCGSRLTVRWGSEDDLILPPDYTPPVVHFGAVSVVPNMDDQTNFQGGPARYLKVTVPQNATTGWVWVHTRGLESNPVWLTVVP